MNLIFILVYVIWFGSEIAINRLLRTKSDENKNTDRHTLTLMWVSIHVAIFAAILIANLWYLPLAHLWMISYMGLALMLLVVFLRYTAIRSLGKQFTVKVQVNDSYKLKTNGMYKIIRHPSYAASWLSFIGFGVSLNNWGSLLFVGVAIWVVFAIRIKVEEEALLRQFGDTYKTYMKNTCRLIPFIY